MARVNVVEPSTGVVFEVESDSPLAKQWKKATSAEVKAAKE